MRRSTAALVAAVLLASPASSAADPAGSGPEPMPTGHLRLLSPGVLRMLDGGGETGRSFSIPPLSHVLDSEEWDLLDAEFRRLQDAEVRLGAENGSLRKSAEEWRPGWRLLVVALVAGAAGGLYLGAKL